MSDDPAVEAAKKIDAMCKDCPEARYDGNENHWEISLTRAIRKAYAPVLKAKEKRIAELEEREKAWAELVNRAYHEGSRDQYDWHECSWWKSESKAKLEESGASVEIR